MAGAVSPAPKPKEKARDLTPEPVSSTCAGCGTTHAIPFYMQIPDSPEELFELLSDQSVKVVFPQYDNLPLMHQKMLRILHAELTKGELSDKSLRDSLLFIVTVWRTLNQRIADHMRYMINDAEEVDTDWFDDYSHFGRMDNYLAIIYQVVEMLPALAPEDDPSSTITGRYSLRGPGD